jgi:hypothetical protein
LIPANQPWVVAVHWTEKYESSPVLEFLADRSYEHRVAIFPLDRFVDVRKLPREIAYTYSLLAQLYTFEWTQHLFQFYNIQSLDIIQEPRVAADKASFESVMLATPLRRWELTNTRYLLGPSAILDVLNKQIDSGRNRFRYATRFDPVAKSGANPATASLEQITTSLNTNGQLAVIEFTGALPRAKLYSNWKVSTNDPAKLQDWVKTIQPRVPAEWGNALASQNTTDLATLDELADESFNPSQTVLLAEPLATPPGTNLNAGEVKFESYAPKRIVLAAKAAAPCVLLLNDKYDPNWRVTVDGQPVKLLRCNFIMRGVFLDKPGEHRVEFRFQPPVTGLQVSAATIVVGLGLLGFVCFAKREKEVMPVQSASAPKNLVKK